MITRARVATQDKMPDCLPVAKLWKTRLGAWMINDVSDTPVSASVGLKEAINHVAGRNDDVTVVGSQEDKSVYLIFKDQDLADLADQPEWAPGHAPGDFEARASKSAS